MFVYDFLPLDVPYEAVTRTLLADDGRWLEPLAVAHDTDGVAVVSLGVHEEEPVLFGKWVAAEVAPPVRSEDVVAVPIRWRATRSGRLVPGMDGYLEASRLGSSRTHLSLMGHYDPPGGQLGRLADRMALHHVAEAGVRSFLRRVAAVLEGADVAATVPRPLPGP